MIVDIRWITICIIIYTIFILFIGSVLYNCECKKLNLAFELRDYDSACKGQNNRYNNMLINISEDFKK